MKIKVLLLIAICAIITLSFVTVNHAGKSPKKEMTPKYSSEQPVGGFASEDPI